MELGLPIRCRLRAREGSGSGFGTDGGLVRILAEQLKHTVPESTGSEAGEVLE